MKEKFFSFSPFKQVLFLVLVGFVGLFTLSMVFTLVFYSIYPEMAGLGASEQAAKYPILFMLSNYLPSQLGLLFVPGFLYYLFTKGENNFVKETNWKNIGWAILLFGAIFFLLPFFSLINFEFLKFIRMEEKLMGSKEASDAFLKLVIGKVGSTSFLTSIIVVGIITGISEELVFRRFLFHHIIKNTGNMWASASISALIFALLHFNYLQFLPLFVFGFSFALMYYVSGSIIPGIIAHVLNNMINLYWLSSETFPSWLEEIDFRLVIPALVIFLMLIVLLIREEKRK